MVKVVITILMVFLVSSCGDKCDDCIDCSSCPACPQCVIAPLEETCKLNLTVWICQNTLCQIKEPMEAVLVELYASKEDAIDRINKMACSTTNALGEIDFRNVACGHTYIRIETEQRGTYIELFSLSSTAETNYEEIRFVEGLVYGNGSEGLMGQSHIDFGNPVLGQQSNYRRFEMNSISYEVKSYTDNVLRVRLINQIEANTFVVEEKIDRIEGTLNWPYYPQVVTLRNRWTFFEDSIRVSPHHDEYFGSFIWNLSDAFEDDEATGYTFSLQRPLDPIIDMENDPVDQADFWGTGSAEDYSLSNHLFENLIVDQRSYVSLDGPKKVIVYSKNDGIVRSMDFYNGMSLISQGFDLLL